jgi:hypothetical protein
MSRIRVTIDRLVLRGMERAEVTALADSLRTQLAQVLRKVAAEQGWKSSRRTPLIKLQMQWESGLPGARKLGAGMARAIGKSLKS